MADLSPQDPLLNLMKMEKEMFMNANAHLPTDEQNRQWAARLVELTSALGSATPTTAVPAKTGAPSDAGICGSTLPGNQQRAATLPGSATGMARCHSVIPSPLFDWPSAG